MSGTIRRELSFPVPPAQVWQSLANSSALTEWMFPNNFEPRVGHRFTFEVPPKPEFGFEGLSVQCEVLQCDEPRLLVFSWSAGELAGTEVSFKLKPVANGTRLIFEHSGFDVSQSFGKQALSGAEYGWSEMLDQLNRIVSGEKEKQK